MKNTANNLMYTLERIRRQAANHERFMQEKADIFQVTGQKEQAMFWSQNLLAR